MLLVNIGMARLTELLVVVPELIDLIFFILMAGDTLGFDMCTFERKSGINIVIKLAGLSRLFP